MQSVQQTYVINQSSGAVTEPVNGNWLQAYCEYLGITEPVNSSWLQALCNYFGITEPLYASWTIALANYYGITAPQNGSWWYAISQAGGAPPIGDLIWNTANTNWELEEEQWATAEALIIDFQNQSFTDDAFPTLVGTATAGTTVFMSIEGNDYETQVDEFGDWSIELINQLPQALAPGNDYVASAYVFDAATGLTSPTVNATITMITTVAVTTITLDMFDSYGDGWNNGWFQLEKETSPGVWEPVEYNENPFRFSDGNQVQAFQASGDMTGAQYYKTDFISGLITGPYGLRFERYEPYVETAWTAYATNGYKDAIGLRSWDLESGNYRTVAVIKGNYTNERSYTIRNGATEIVSKSGGDNWEVGDVQTTFTI